MRLDAVAYNALISTSDVSAEELERFIERLTTRSDRSIQRKRDAVWFEIR